MGGRDSVRAVAGWVVCLRVSQSDADEARQAGAAAVKAAVVDDVASGSIAIKRRKTKKYAVSYEPVALRNVAKETRHMPASFINKKGNHVTQAFIDYARPLVEPLTPAPALHS